MATVEIGLMAIGLNTYWAQFEGLYDRLLKYKIQIYSIIEKAGVKVIDAGMVDDVEKAYFASDLFEKEGVKLIFVYISTYALSSTVLPAISRKSARIILLNIQPSSAMDYAGMNAMTDIGHITGEWLANCQACSLPEIASVCNRSGIGYSIINGYLGDKNTVQEIKQWVEAAKAVSALRNTHVGLLGHYYGGMLDVYSDLTILSAVFGCHFEQLEMCRLKAIRDSVDQKSLETKIEEFQNTFIVAEECSLYELERAAKTSVALDKLVDENGLGGLAYYYEGIDEYRDIVTSIIAGSTVLTGKGVPVAGEYEVKNLLAMKIMSLLGAGGSFSEFYAMDFNDDVVLLGHDGPAHYNMAEGEVHLVPLPVYHGKPGRGLSIQMSVRHGDVTLLSVCECSGKIFLLYAEGKSVDGPILNIGNTNSRYKFPVGIRTFMENWASAGPSHHFAIGVGHIGEKLEKVAKIMNIQTVRIC